MSVTCLQHNECLACLGGCEGYGTKREEMIERRAAYWRAAHEMNLAAWMEIAELRNKVVREWLTATGFDLSQEGTPSRGKIE